MVLNAQTPVRILHRASYDSPERAAAKIARGERPITFQDGSLVEFVDLHDSDTGGVIRATVAQGLNGEAAQDMVGHAELELTVDTNGRKKLKLVGFTPAK